MEQLPFFVYGTLIPDQPNYYLWKDSITDTKKVMTPYFTTKKTGTGLGLAIVSKIINEHSGDLNITNNKPEGVTITISLPSL